MIFKVFDTLDYPNSDFHLFMQTLELTAFRKWCTNNKQNQLQKNSSHYF